MAKKNWEARHLDAMCSPSGHEIAHVKLFEAVKRCTAQGWHNDGYACEYVIDLTRAARKLLSMASGRIECGSLDAFYVAVLKSCGVDE